MHARSAACRSGLRSFPSGHLFAQVFLLLPQFGSELGAEIFDFKYRAQLDLNAAAERSALEPLDGFVRRLHLPQPEAGDQVVGFGNGPLITVRFGPPNFTRTPSELGCNPPQPA